MRWCSWLIRFGLFCIGTSGFPVWIGSIRKHNFFAVASHLVDVVVVTVVVVVVSVVDDYVAAVITIDDTRLTSWLITLLFLLMPQLLMQV